MAIEYKATDLPGKTAYDKNFNVQIRCITPIEQKYILSLSQKEQRTTQDYIDFLKKLIKIDNPEVKFEDLYWFDVQYLLYKIRFLTYPNYPIKLTFICDECNERIIQDIDIGNLQIDEPNSPKTLLLDNLGETHIRNKTVGDDLVIEAFIKKNKLDIDDLQTRLLLVDLCLISNGKSLDEMYALAEKGEITATDIVRIEQWIEKSVWGVNEVITTKCEHCKKEASRGYSLSIEDFFSVVY